jgi:hypothetical protein
MKIKFYIKNKEKIKLSFILFFYIEYAYFKINYCMSSKNINPYKVM